MSTMALRPRWRWHRLSRPPRLALIIVLTVCCAVTGVVTVALQGATSAVAVTKVTTDSGVPQAAPVVGNAGRPSRPLPVVATVAAAPPVTTVTLHSGDTLWGLAQRYGTTVAALQTLNHLGDSTLIYAGTQLRVAGSASATAAQPAKLAAVTHHQATITHPTSTLSGSVRQIAAQVFGSQYGCAAAIINRESGWNVSATNPSSGAYGLAQALPAGKMATAGPDWRTNPATQLTWMRGYMDSRYGGACGAWAFWQAHAWY